MFTDEKEVERYVRQLIKDSITVDYPHVYALDYRTIGDIVVCRDDNDPELFFMEIKLFKESNGRIGVGGKGGSGIQPEVIGKAPKCLEQHLLWVLADGMKAEPTFVLATTRELRNYIVGGEIGRKQNNIQLRIFDEMPQLNAGALLQRLCTWLSP
ncbi:MAG: hypothetical protein BZY75_00480 [SAR202 cluster bacterium Io17-Chloro-G7]|nr:MAG: hypothetical protein BZY75_00480 [SAR202 cluster bacterium Io17-Chloro-G7]